MPGTDHVRALPGQLPVFNGLVSADPACPGLLACGYDCVRWQTLPSPAAS